MPRTKKGEAKKKVDKPVETIVKTLKEEAVVETPKTEVAVEESAEKKSFRAYMESYKVKNPVKYAQKEKTFLTQLEQIK